MIQRIARRAFDVVRPSRAVRGVPVRGVPVLGCLEALEPRWMRAADPPREVLYADVGVGGSQQFHVSTPLYVALAPFGNSADIDNLDSFPDVYTQDFGPLRTQVALDAADDVIGPLDVFGMPVMAGKDVVMDARPLNAENPEDLGTMKTYVYPPGTPFNADNDQEDPGIPTTNLHVDLSYASFARFSEVTPAGAPGPTLAHNPFIGPNPIRAIDPTLPPDNTPGVTIGESGRTFTGSFLLDTGAVASMISQHAAQTVGVSYADGTYGTDSPRLVDSAGNDLPNQFALTIGGVGGSTKVAGFFLDAMTLPTVEGAPIEYDRAPVLVSDVTVADPRTGQELTLDGIFGMNAMVASALVDENDPLGFPTDITAGPYDWIVFDEPHGVLGLNLPDQTPVRGTPVVVEGVQPVALDQPRVNAALRETPDGDPLTADGGFGFESFNIEAFFDTGASGVLLSKETAEGLGVQNETVPAPQGVWGRHLFYNNSALDGHSALADDADDDAVATDKDALAPGATATFANVSSYAKGINGVMVDIADLPAGGTVTASDFAFRVGNVSATSGWTAAPAPASVSVRPGAGTDGTDRVTLTWSDGAIKNTWLQVTVKANADTGLAQNDVFYFGSLIGETGNASAAPGGTGLAVNALDLAGVKRSMNATSVIGNAFDFDRNGLVNALDLATVRSNYSRSLQLITPPPPAVAGASRQTAAPPRLDLLA